MKNLKTLLAELVESMNDFLYHDGSESDVELVLEAVQNHKDLEGKISKREIRNQLKKFVY